MTVGRKSTVFSCSWLASVVCGMKCGNLCRECSWGFDGLGGCSLLFEGRWEFRGLELEDCRGWGELEIEGGGNFLLGTRGSHWTWGLTLSRWFVLEKYCLGKTRGRSRFFWEPRLSAVSQPIAKNNPRTQVGLTANRARFGPFSQMQEQLLYWNQWIPGWGLDKTRESKFPN